MPTPPHAELALPAGIPGSGRRRYAAAMWFHLHSDLPEAALEVYRALALDDGADPLAELARLGLEGAVQGLQGWS